MKATRIRIMLLFLSLAVAVLAQQSTEVYIPIGQSPGLSREGKTTIGIVSNRVDTLFTVNDRVFLIYTGSKVYLDRSHLKKSNGYGTATNVHNGSFVEAYAPQDGLVEWVKIKVKDTEK